ncbi:MAG: hypothetical protein IAF02_02840 [Anaerolineae bacterium]|nr:hypothetical protein [Anaerolineae bacterium]
MKRQILMMVWIGLLLVACGGQAQEATPTTTRMSDLDRVAGLLDGFEVEERPLPFPPETVQAKAGLHFITPNEQVEILLFELESGGDFARTVAQLAEAGIDVAAEAPLSFAGTNGDVLFIIRNVADPAQQEEIRWMVSKISGALAGEE